MQWKIQNPDLQYEHDKIAVPIQQYVLSQFSTTNEEIVELPLEEESKTKSYVQGNENIQNTQTSNSEDTNNFDYDNNDSVSDDDNNPIPPDYFRVEEEAQLPRNHFEMNYFDREIVSTPIHNLNNDKILQCDEERGWKRPFPDDMPYQGPFMAKWGLNIEMETKNPEDFFNLMFDTHMFETIADETNQNARSRIRNFTQGRDPIQQMVHPDNKKYNRLYQWKDVNSTDIKIFMAHIIVMSLVRKSAVHSYWSRNSLSHMPFFGKYLSRNKFQNILWHLHLNNIADNPPPGCPGHDPLAWLRNIITMAQDNFKRVYIPWIDVDVNESTCTFHGRVKFLQYNKSKPNKFHIKLFMASEKYTGYILSFLVYTGSESNELVKRNATLDPPCSITTKMLWDYLKPEICLMFNCNTPI